MVSVDSETLKDATYTDDAWSAAMSQPPPTAWPHLHITEMMERSFQKKSSVLFHAALCTPVALGVQHQRSSGVEADMPSQAGAVHDMQLA